MCSFSQKVALPVSGMQRALFAGGYYFSEKPDLCRSRHINGQRVPKASKATERIKIAIAPLSILAAQKNHERHFAFLYKSAVARSFNKAKPTELKILLENGYRFCDDTLTRLTQLAHGDECSRSYLQQLQAAGALY